MAGRGKVSGLHSREGRLSLIDLLEKEGIGPSDFSTIIGDMTPKQRAMLMVFVKLTEFYANSFKDTVDLYEEALRSNVKLKEWIDSRLPGETDLL